MKQCSPLTNILKRQHKLFSEIITQHTFYSFKNNSKRHFQTDRVIWQIRFAQTFLKCEDLICIFKALFATFHWNYVYLWRSRWTNINYTNYKLEYTKCFDVLLIFKVVSSVRSWKAHDIRLYTPLKYIWN